VIPFGLALLLKLLQKKEKLQEKPYIQRSEKAKICFEEIAAKIKIKMKTSSVTYGK